MMEEGPKTRSDVRRERRSEPGSAQAERPAVSRSGQQLGTKNVPIQPADLMLIRSVS